VPVLPSEVPLLRIPVWQAVLGADSSPYVVLLLREALPALLAPWPISVSTQVQAPWWSLTAEQPPQGLDVREGP
jgi:hypothetical protein